MTWCKCLIQLFQKCCGKKSYECERFTNDDLASFKSNYTVRRISSFGQTIINEDGEESELARHSSIITYGGESLPWSSKPAPVQPGVTHSDVIDQIKKLPTINENPKKLKQKHKWKKAAITQKNDSFPKFSIDNNCSQDLLLYPLKRNALGRAKNVLESNSASQDDLFSKCKTKNEGKIQSAPTLTVHKAPTKSISSPDLVHCEVDQKSTDLNNEKIYDQTLDGSLIFQSIEKKEEKKSIEAERVAKMHGLDLSLYTQEALNPFNIQTKSFSTTKTQIWTEEPSGTLDISLNLNSLQKLLMVTVNAIHSLCGEGMDKEPFSTIIKLTLLSKKKVVKSSKEITADLNPKVDQGFTFSIKDIDSRAIRFSVYNAQWQGKYDAVGHSLLPIHDNLHVADNMLLKLYSHLNPDKSIGMIQISFGFDGKVFNITVDKIFDFDTKLKRHKIYAKIAYYSNSKKIKEKASPVIWAESEKQEIQFNYDASFKFEYSGKCHSFILVSVKNNEEHTIFKQGKTLGRAFLGPYFYSESGNLTPWGKAIINKQNLCYSFKLCL